MNANEWSKTAVYVFFSLGVIYLAFTLPQQAIDDTQQKISACTSAQGIVETENCGFGCIKDICIIQKDNVFYKKEIKKVNHKWVLIEGGNSG